MYLYVLVDGHRVGPFANAGQAGRWLRLSVYSVHEAQLVR